MKRVFFCSTNIKLIRFLETLRENKYIHLNKDGEEAQKAGSASKQCCREA